jgi:tight adherence protein B
VIGPSPAWAQEAAAAAEAATGVQPIIYILLGVLLLIAVVGIGVAIRRIISPPKTGASVLKETLAPYLDQDYFRRLDEAAAAAAAAGADAAKASFRERLAEALGNLILFKGIQAKHAKNLALAGIRMKANEFILIKCIVAIILFFLGFAVSFRLWVGIIVGFVGWLMPNTWLKMKVSGRRRAFQGQLLDVLIQMSNGLRAGYSFLQAMEAVAREMPPPVSEEFSRVTREISLGKPVDDALLDLAERMQSKDLDFVVTVIQIQRQIGGNLSEILDSVGATIRERLRLMGQIRALTAQGKMGGIVIAALPFGLFIIMYMLNPEVQGALFTTEPRIIGWILVGVGLIMQSIGAFVIKKMVVIEM